MQRLNWVCSVCNTPELVSGLKKGLKNMERYRKASGIWIHIHEFAIFFKGKITFGICSLLT